MPTTSSLFSPITGKRECRVSSTSGMNSAGSSSIDTTSICARGIMMSRTVISDTCSTPSIIDSASASSSLRSKAPCRSSSSSSRSSGSRVRNADSRSSSVGLSACRSRRRPSVSGGAAARPRVGVGDAERGEDRGLARLHRARGAVGVVVVALQVQHAVDDEVRAVVGERLALRRAPPAAAPARRARCRRRAAPRHRTRT